MSRDEEKYTLGARDIEQRRLFLQRELYGDGDDLAKSIKPNDTVCEVGCGAGANLAVLKPTNTYVGIDILKKQAEAAKTKAKELGLSKTSFHVSNGTDLPFLPNDSMDFTFCRLVLIHQPLIPQAAAISVLAEMIRVTKIGGIVRATEPDVASYTSNKPALNKCWEARCRFAYPPEKGSASIATKLPAVFAALALAEVATTVHEIEVSASEPEKLAALYLNWIVMIQSVKDQLVTTGLITEAEFEAAQKEATDIQPGDYVRQSLVSVHGRKRVMPTEADIAAAEVALSTPRARL